MLLFLRAVIYFFVIFILNRMVKTFNRIHKAVACIEYFTTREWDFPASNVGHMMQEMNEEDRLVWLLLCPIFKGHILLTISLLLRLFTWMPEKSIGRRTSKTTVWGWKDFFLMKIWIIFREQDCTSAGMCNGQHCSISSSLNVQHDFSKFNLQVEYSPVRIQYCFIGCYLALRDCQFASSWRYFDNLFTFIWMTHFLIFHFSMAGQWIL
jgi:Male sterility protein